MSANYHIKLLIAGELNQEFAIDLSGRPTNNYTGGSLLYAAAGARMWREDIGLVSRIGSNFPAEWLTQIEKRGLDIRGIDRLPQEYDQRRFYFWRDAEHAVYDAPVSAYAHYGLTFPHDLLGYTGQSNDTVEKMWKNVSLNLPNLPPEYLDVSGAHLCPLNQGIQIKLLSIIQKSLVNTISVSPSDDYMVPSAWLQLPAILKGISVFLPTEAQLISLFQGQSQDIWEMTAALSELGCPLIIVDCGKKGHCLYNGADKSKYILPFYPTRWLNPTGIGQVFAGAFLAEFKDKYSPDQALISAAASASIAVEGSGPFYCLDSFAGLANARCEVLHTMLKKI